MTAATFGDVLGAARRHLDAATGVTGSIADPESITTAAAITGRLAMTLSRFLADVAPYDMAEVITSSTLGAQMRAAVQAREALQLAADGLRTGTRDQDRPGPEPADPLTAHLATAAAALAAGRDLLRTHATTGTDGHWKPRSRWAAVIGSELVGQALAAEVALCSKPLTLLTAWLSVAAQADAATPAPIRQGLAAASPLLLTATTTLTAAQHEHPATALDAELLRSIPVNHLPPPRPPRDNETVTDLAAGIAISAARIHALHPATAGQAAWAPELTAESWRWTATGAAIICDISHLMLTSLTHRASQFDDTPAVTAQLHAAADSTATACTRWREVRAAWQDITTETGGLTAAVIPDTRDLIVRLGRLAFNQPRWTPVRARRAPPRDPTELAPDPAQAAAVTGAIHHAADTLASMADTDLRAVRQARSADRLYMATRKLPDYYDVPYRHWKAHASAIAALLDAYQAASAASSRAVTDLDALAVTLNAPSRILAAARAATTSTSRARTPPTVHTRRIEPATEPVCQPDLAAPAPPGPVERAIRELGTADFIMLLRAHALDQAARMLLTEAQNSISEPGPPCPPHRHSRPAPPAKTPAQLAAMGFPPTPAAPTPGQQRARPTLPSFDDQAARQIPGRTYVSHGRLHVR
jgi:hypothetical protein